MPTTSSSLDKQLTPLTQDEEELFQRVVSRLEAYFRDFEELEGFSVLRSNVDRLFRKVVLEVRCVCYEYHDSYVAIDNLRAEIAAQQDEFLRHQALCDKVVVEAEATKKRFHALRHDAEQEIDKLHAFYETQQNLLKKQWTLDSESQQQQAIEALTREHAAKIELLHEEHKQQRELVKKQAENTKNVELEYMEVQLRLQITSQVSRDLGKKLARQEKLCEKHTEEMRQLQRRLGVLQEAQKRSQSDQTAKPKR